MYMLNTRGAIIHEKSTDEMTPNDDEELACRICMEPGPRSDFIAPCACRGSSKWVHRECLDKWRTTREDRAFSRCTECLASYKLVARSADTFQTKCLRRTKFGCYVFRDLSLSFAGVQLVIALMAWVVATSDSSGTLVNYFHAAAWPTLFYYCCGWVVFLSSLGLMFFCGVGRGNPMMRDDCCLTLYCCDDCCFLARHNPGACCVCTHDCCVCGDACVCCEASSLSAELVPVLLVIVVILAVVGAFVAIFAGAVFLNQIVQSHVHVLHKKGAYAPHSCASLLSLAAPSDRAHLHRT
jgi:hypothetical protein